MYHFLFEPDTSAMSHKFRTRFRQFNMFKEIEHIPRKSEYRNPKQYQNPNVLNSKHIVRHVTAAVRFGNWYFGHLNLFRASILEFRISPSLINV